MTQRAVLIDALDRLLAPFEEVEESTPAPPATPEAPSAQDETVTIRLSASDAFSGTQRVIRFTTSEPCRRCDGTGVRGGTRPCRRCKASGVETTERALRLRIPPAVKNGTELLVRGEAGRTRVDGPRGNLLVRVQVDG
jgi:DnaJ-class molecular chaperone